MGWSSIMRFGKRMLPTAGGVAAGTALAGIAVDTFKNIVPQLEDEVTVEVHGKPGARKKDLYYLALATAFGLIRRFDLGFGKVFPTPPVGMLMVEYDAASNWVRATVRYNTSLLATAVTSNAAGGLIGGGLGFGLGFLIGSPLLGLAIGTTVGELLNGVVKEYTDAGRTNKNDFYAQAVVYSGPKDHVVGGQFNFTGLAGLAGVPNTPDSEGAPKLPLTGQVILTTVAAPNPTPAGDHTSRGVVANPAGTFGDVLNKIDPTAINRKLVPLVFAALTDAGSFAKEMIEPRK